MKKLIIISILLISVLESYAQRNRHCPQGDLPCIEKNFNTLVHIAVDSATLLPIMDADSIQQILEKTSTYFDAICMSFTNCEFNIMQENYSYNNIKEQPIPLLYRLSKMEKIFSKPNRLNIFVVNSIDSIIGGYGEFEGIFKPDSMNVWIEVDNHEFELSENLAHQLGHFFGLRNTYDVILVPEKIDGSNCATAGDFICDTPADPYERITFKDGEAIEFEGAYIDSTTCEFIFPLTDENENKFSPDVRNMMSQYACKCTFSCEQYFKMAENYALAKIKPY